MMKNRHIAFLIPFALFAVSSNAYSDPGLKFAAELSRAQEVPPTTSGLITESKIKVDFDDDLSQVEVDLKVEGGDNFAAAHFHCARAGENGPIAFGLVNPGPLGFDGRRIRGTLTNEAFTGADCIPTIGRPVNNIASLAFAMRDGLIYINVHTTDNRSGEVRGQLLPLKEARPFKIPPIDIGLGK